MLVTIKKLLSVLLLAIVLTAIFTWPFSRYLGSYYYDRGDYALTGFLISWNENAILSGKLFDKEYYFNGGQFYPQPYSQLFSDLRLLPTLIFIPIHFLTQNFVLSLNLVIFLSFVLSFLSSFFVINYFLKDKYASIIGGVIYTFNPLTFSRIPEHFELLQKYLLPIVFWSAYKLIQKPGLKNSLLFSAIFTLNCFSAIYFQIFTLILLPLFLTPFIVVKIADRDTEYFKKLFINFSVFIFFIPVILYFNLGYKNFSDKELATRSLETAGFFSARLIDYFSSTKQSLLYGEWTKFLDPYRSPKDLSGNFNYIEHTLFLGIIPTLLFLLGCYLIIKNRNFFREKDLLLTSFLIVAVISFILTFGPFFYWWNSDKNGLPMPYYFLYQVFPLLHSIRAPARFLFLFYVPFSLICTYSLVFIFEKIKRKSLILLVTFGLVLGLAAENINHSAPIVSYTEMSGVFNKPKTNLEFLKDKKVLHLPLNIPNFGYEGEYLNWAVKTKSVIVNGNSGYIPPEQEVFLNEIKDFDKEKIKWLGLIGVDYIIIHKNKLQDFKEIADSLKDKRHEDKDIVIYQVTKPEERVCDFQRDFSYEIKNAVIENLNKEVTALILQNRSDCYLTNIYSKKYQTIKISQQGYIGGPIEKTIYFKMPVIIKPKEQVILTDYQNQLKVE